MKVILSDDIENLGEMGQTVKVADGFARNYLIPRKLAVTADSASAKQIEHEMRIIKKREEKRRAEARALVKQLEKITVEVQVRAGEGDKIFGSVTTGHIAEKLAEQGFEISRKLIHLAEPIKTLGIFNVPVKMPGGIEAEIKVWVSRIVDEESAPVAEVTETESAEDKS